MAAVPRFPNGPLHLEKAHRGMKKAFNSGRGPVDGPWAGRQLGSWNPHDRRRGLSTPAWRRARFDRVMRPAAIRPPPLFLLPLTGEACCHRRGESLELQSAGTALWSQWARAERPEHGPASGYPGEPDFAPRRCQLHIGGPWSLAPDVASPPTARCGRQPLRAHDAGA